METFYTTVIKKGVREKTARRVSEEVPLTIEVNGKELVTLLASPDDLENLVVPGAAFQYGDVRTDAYDIARARRVDHDRVLEHLLDRHDAPFDEGLLVLRFVVGGIFHNVAFFFRRVDALRDLCALDRAQVLQLSFQFRATGRC